MKPIFPTLILFLFAVVAESATLAGFRVERLGPTAGFPTSIVADSKGRIYYTTIDGAIYRFDGAMSTKIGSVTTDGTGNSGLLGMALVDDRTAVVHYTTPQQTYDVISKIDLADGTETILHRFAGDIDLPGRPTPTEHHGGNPSVAADGSIFVPIGDYGWNFIAPDQKWNGGKIFRIASDGTVTQFARGLRNPFDVVWDEASKRLIVADNGPTRGDEIHIIENDTDCGWPHTWGSLPPVSGAAVPDFVFPSTTAPTGVLLLNKSRPHMRRGFLVGGFVSRAIYYFPDQAARPLPSPLALIEKETPPVIDIAQTKDGDIYFAAGGFSPGASAIYRLITPKCGDCNGDGRVNAADYDALTSELSEGTVQLATAAESGTHRGTWGCDVDEDGFVTAADAVELSRMLGWRRRAAGR